MNSKDLKRFLDRVLIPIGYKGFVVVTTAIEASNLRLVEKEKAISIPISSISQSNDNTFMFTVESPISSEWTAEIVDALIDSGVLVKECTLNKPELIDDEYIVKTDYIVEI